MATNQAVISIQTTSELPGDMGRPFHTLNVLSNFLTGFASGSRFGTVDVQYSASTTPAGASATMTFTSVAAGMVIVVNGVPFRAVSGTPVRTNNEFKRGVSDTADAADFATTFNASSLSTALKASAASGVVTVSSQGVGADQNAATLETFGITASGTLTPTAVAATDTFLINGTTFTCEQEMARQTATVSTGVAGDTVVVNGVTFTCVASGATGNQFNKGATDTATAANLALAINACTNGGVSGLITASSSTTTLKLRAVASGTAANSYTLTATGGWTATGATFTGGAATSNNKFDYGDTNDQCVNEMQRAINASTTALVNQHVSVTPVHQVTVSSGSGAETININGTAISSTWATSDTATAAALVTALNANATVAALLTASSAAGVITLAPASGASFTVSVSGTGMSLTSLLNVYAQYPGVRGNCITISGTGGVAASGARLTAGTVAQHEGVQASGTVTILSGSGNYTVTINGVNASGTVAYNSTDTQTASDIRDAINKSTNALVQGVVVATSSSGVVTITSVRGGVAGNAITLACTGTGATASVARLASGAAPTQATMGGSAVTAKTFPGARLGGGVGLSAGGGANAAGLTF